MQPAAKPPRRLQNYVAAYLCSSFIIRDLMQTTIFFGAFLAVTMSLSAAVSAAEPVADLHALTTQAAAWMMASAFQDDSVRLKIGDPTNTDLPTHYPSSRLNRFGAKRGPIKIPPGYGRQGSVDSMLQRMYLREMFEGTDIGTPYSLDLDTYLKGRQADMLDKLRDSSLFSYELKKPKSQGELTRLIDQATNITIPLPPNPLLGIFGKPEISINVNGEVNVQAGWRWDSQRLGTASALGQTQSAPIFSQNIQVNVSARIGDKFRMNVDWNTLNQFEFNNRFKVGYEGYDDDIVKKVEFGNVNLETQSTLIGGGQTLFGVRSDYQFGPLYLKTIASQRRGERKFINARGGTSKNYFSIRAYDYARNHFFLDTNYFRIWREYFRTSTPVLPISGDSLVVKELEVWESETEVKNITTNDAVAIADLPSIQYAQLPVGERYPISLKNQSIRAGYVEQGRFSKLDPKRYELDMNLGKITILNMRQDRYYAVAYRTEGPTKAPEDDRYHGTLTRNLQVKDTLILKLVSRPEMQPGYPLIWDRMMRNVYPIGVLNASPTDTKIGLWYFRNTNDSVDVLEGAPDKIVTIFRLDQVNNGTGAEPPDGQFDSRPPVFNAQRGEITFPSLEPFREGLREYFAKEGNPQIAEQYIFNEVYDTTYVTARLNAAKDRFVIIGEASGTASGSGNRIPLNYNVAPGSVKVTLDGAPLREGIDYTVDYYSGSLTLLNARATLPNANLNVEYENNDVFNLTTRTLVGVRADYQLFNRRKTTASLGMTMMNFDQSAVVDRVQPGQEPNSNLMLGFDGRLTSDLAFLTRALDALPFFDTKAPSSLNVSGEWAMVAPTPNKRTSNVISDQGKAVAYLDDFESARKNITFGLSPSLWEHSSAPQDLTLWDNDTMAALFRGRAYWFQRFVPDVALADVYPRRSRQQGQSNISPLRIVFEPTKRGIYNKNPEFVDDENPTWNGADSMNVRAGAQAFNNANKSRIWAGMTRILSAFSTNFDADNNIDYIEIMMHLDAYEPSSKMYIDLGQISEDVIPDKRLNTEDSVPQNNLIDVGEDIGIDTIDNAREITQYPFPLNQEKDPARDDYFFNFGGNRQDQPETDFTKYNNYEGNSSQSELGQFPDKEILNENNGQTIALDNSYFRYEVNLNPNPETNPQIVGGNASKGWFLYRIPIRKPDTLVGNPLFTNIQYIRVSFRGGLVKLSVADWGVVGSYWLRNHQLQSNVPENDSVLSVTYINREENGGPPDFYDMPPGVTPPQVLNNPDPFAAQFLNEQSLVVRTTNLRYGEERMAVRVYRPWDLFYYKELAFFIHGDQTMPDRVTTGATPPAYSYIRFGVDSANYYEYRRPLLRGWQDLRIVLSDLTAIKQIRDQARYNDRQEFPVPNDPQGTYAIKGSPILTRVTYFGFGVANPSERFPNELTTTMWVDELRLVSPVNNSDWAAIGSINLKLADLADVTAAISHTNPNFHRLEERFGGRSQITSWNFGVTAGLEKFLPKELKEVKIPISYTHSEDLENPLYQAQNDVELLRAAEASRNDTLVKGASLATADKVYNDVRTRSQKVIVRDQWGLTGVRLGIPTKLWWIDDTFNKLTFNYVYAQEFQRTQVVQNRFEWRWRFRTDYNVTIPSKYDVSPLKFLESVPGLKAYKDMKINFAPQSLTMGLNMTRARTTEQSRFLPFPSPIVREFIAEKTLAFNWRLVENGFLSPTIDYRVVSMSTLADHELDENGRQRTGGDLFSQMFFGNGKLDFGKDNNYTQTVTINVRPRLPDILGINRLIETTGSYTAVYNLQDPLQPDPATRDVVRVGRVNTTTRLSPIIRWRQIGQEIFGAPKKEAKSTLEDVASVFQEVLFGFDNLTLVYTQNNNTVNPGVMGGTGFSNLWARTMTFRGNDPMWGPSTAYQLGLTSNPHGGIGVEGSSKFPFFKFTTSTGPRPPNAVMQDNFTQRNTVQLQTSRPLWPGATLDLTMKSDFGYSKDQRVLTDANGVPSYSNINIRQTLDRTFVSIPTWFFGVSNDGVDEVVRLYREKAAVLANEPDTSKRNQQLLDALAESFRDGFESLQLFSGELARIAPALNYTLRWDGIEKFGPLKGIAQRIFIEHAYQSSYQENARITDNGRVIEVQQVKTGFTPLIGLNMNFDEKALKGTLTGTLRYNVTQAHTLNTSARSTIGQEISHELQINASYLRRGVSLKFLGLDLENDMEFSFLGQFRRSLQGRFDVIDYKPDADLVQGTTTITIEPRARYTISQRVTASAFVRYEGNFSSGAANPGFSTTQVGLDIRLSISGGR